MLLRGFKNSTQRPRVPSIPLWVEKRVGDARRTRAAAAPDAVNVTLRAFLAVTSPSSRKIVIYDCCDALNIQTACCHVSRHEHTATSCAET